MLLSRLALAVVAAGIFAGSVSAADERSFVPVYRINFPDPDVVLTKDGFVAYSTNDGANLPMAISKDLVSWTPAMDPANPGKRLDGMPVLASWAKTGATWAPEVERVGANYLLYYTANNRKLDRQCVGLAVADNPLGPFRDTTDKPLVCQVELGGTIDANIFRDTDGKLFLYYKNDGNRVSKVSEIWGQRLSDDGKQVIGDPVSMLRDSKGWEQRLVEAPSMVRTATGYQMFYSGGFYGWNDDQRISPYAMGYATCSSALGPCTPSGDNPILHSFNEKSAGCVSGPGHQSIFSVGARQFIAFHAWAATKGCRKSEDKRELYVAPISWRDGKPVIGMSLRPR